MTSSACSMVDRPPPAHVLGADRRSELEQLHRRLDPSLQARQVERRPLLVLRVQVERVAAEPALRLVVEAREREEADEVGGAVVGGPEGRGSRWESTRRSDCTRAPRSFSERTTA